jgi:hypothetical protein
MQRMAHRCSLSRFGVARPQTLMLWLALHAGAFAGSVEGQVSLPSRALPAMTVYAQDLDTTRTRSIALAHGQQEFSFELPAGRYWLFAAPSAAGAPDVYVAYTRFTLCTAAGSSDCVDHTPAELTISANAPHAKATLDDWDLADAVAEHMDQIRGIVASGDARGQQASGAPRFSEYPSAAFEGTAPAIESSDLSAQDRSALQVALAGGPNFAGHMSLASGECGPECRRLLLMDWRSGAVLVPPRVEINGTLPCRSDDAVLFQRDSRLLRITSARGDAILIQYYVWNPQTGELVSSGATQQSRHAFCSGAAR